MIQAFIAFALACMAVQQPAPANYDESRVPHYTLPPILTMKDGRPVRTAAEWKARREEIRSLLEEQMFGRAPGRPMGVKVDAPIDRAALGGLAVRKDVSIDVGGKTLRLQLYLPAGAKGRSPVFLGLGFGPNQTVAADPRAPLAGAWVRNDQTGEVSRDVPTDASRGTAGSRWQLEKLLARGYGLATVYYGDLEPDFDGALRQGIRAAYLAKGRQAPADDEWGAIAAWAWGLARAVDYLETDRDVDASKIALVGHSRLGKTALWAGAMDPRVAIVVSNDSGEGGAAISRRRFGETVADLNSRFPHWFCGNYRQYDGREDAMPFDAHMLLALIAPRPLYVASAEDDRWADPKGEFLAAAAASEVYELLGKKGVGTKDMPPVDRPVGDAVRYHVRAGGHDITAYDWEQYLDFADRHLGAPVPQPPPVRVTGGLVAGAPGRDPSITAFKGIPFAAAPVRERRWQAPAPVVPWQGVRRADRFAPSCVQAIVPERKPWTWEFMTHNEIGEDCLYLNVWTGAASPAERRPVFVYIYGGGFSEGSGAVPAYDGEGLAKRGLVVVVPNYRVGVLGFLAHPGLSQESETRTSGNYGLLDQVAALRWVRENVAALGGDPDRVTIAGQSAGGMSVHSLIASPLARGLFHRAIVQSGGSSVGGGRARPGPPMLAEAEADGRRFAEAKGAASIADLRAASWQTLIEPLPKPAAGVPGLRFAPNVDGFVLPAPAREVVVQGKHNDVPILTGVNAGELGGLAGPQEPVTVQSFREGARRQFGALADEFLALYPAATDEQAAAAQAESSRELALVSMHLWARERARTSKTPAFTYLWDHALPGPDAARFGAFHSSEVPYVLDTLYTSGRPFAEADRTIAAMMSTYWANFAAAGDPNGNGLPAWPASGEAREVMEVGDRTGPVPLTRTPARYAFFERFLLR